MPVPNASPFRRSLRAAQAYGVMGWRCMPCRSTKEPLLRDWPTQAAADESILKEIWWRAGRAAEATGMVILAGACVLDLDVDPTKEVDGLAALQALAPGGQELLPEAWRGPVARTPRGGYHLFGLDPRPAEQQGNGRGRLPAGVDVRGGGRGFVVVPAGGDDGRTWLRPLVPAVELPELPWWIGDLLVQPQATRSAPSSSLPSADGRRSEMYLTGAVRRACEVVRSASPGERNQTLNDEALSVARLVAGSDREMDARDELQRAGLDAGLTESEVRKTLASAWRAAEGMPKREAPAAEPAPMVKAKAVAQAASVMDPWPDPGELPAETDPVPDLDPELLPSRVRPFLEEFSEGACVPLAMPAVSAMVALSSIVGRKVGIRPDPNDDWVVVPNLWGLAVAPPGSMKSACMDAGVEPLRPLIRDAREQYETELRLTQARRIAVEGKLKNYSRTKNADEAEIQLLLEEKERLQVVERRFYVQDATTEKLGEILRDNPNGVLLYRDELSGWLRSMDRPGREGDREFYLESWNGTGSYISDRIGRGTIYIPGMCLSVIGSVQPGKLRAYVADATGTGSGADGMLQRFQLLVWPDQQVEWKPRTKPLDAGVRQVACDLYHYLDAAPAVAFAAQDNGPGRPPVLRFDADAQQLFMMWRKWLEDELASPATAGAPGYAGHLGKYRSLMPSLALLLHLTEGGQGPVPLEAVRRAGAWCDFLHLHARKVYSAELNPAGGAAKALGMKVRSGALEDGVSVRELCRASWSGLTNPDVVEAGLGALARSGWVRLAETRAMAGRPSRVVLVNPKARQGVDHAC